MFSLTKYLIKLRFYLLIWNPYKSNYRNIIIGIRLVILIK